MGSVSTMASRQPTSLEQKWREEKLALMEKQIAEGSLVVRRLSPKELANYRPGSLTRPRQRGARAA